MRLLPRIHLFFKKIDFRKVRLRNVQLKECSISTCVVCCLSFFLNAKRKVSIRMAPTRNSYSKENNIEAIQWHYGSGNIVIKTAKNFSIDSKQIRS